LLKPREEIPRRLYISLMPFLFIVILVLWSVVTYGGVISPLFLPSPSKVVETMISMFKSGGLWGDTWASFYRVSMGFLLAAVLAVPLGLLMGTYKLFEAPVEPLMGFFRYLPASAFIPLLILWVGITDMEKILVIFIGTFFQLTLMIADTIRRVPMDLLWVSYTLGVDRKSVLYKVLLPAALPEIVDNLRIAMGWAWTYLVVAEIVAATTGLGFMIMQSQRFLRTDKIFVGIVIIGLLGIITDQVFKYVHRILFPWVHG